MVRGSGMGTVRFAPGADGAMRLEASKMTMPALAETLSRFVDRPIIDMTELKGNYQVTLQLAMADMMNAARSAGMPVPPGAMMRGGPQGGPPTDSASDPAPSSIFAAVQQLGLRLEARKDAVETIVVDHLEKMPSEN